MHYYNEHDKNAAAWIRELIAEQLIPAGEVDERSIVDVTPADLKRFTSCHFFGGIAGWPRALRLAGWPDDRPVWTGSCPCQPFSSAGGQQGQADERHLWPVFFELIRRCRPPVVFGEQVASSLVVGTVKRPVRKAGQHLAEEAPVWLDGVFADLESAHYTCGAAVLGAHSVGAPHIRQRLYWVAYDQGQGREGVESQRTTGKLVRTWAGGGGADGGLGDTRRQCDELGRGTGDVGRTAGKEQGEARQREWGGDADSGAGVDDDGGLAHHHHHQRSQGRGRSELCKRSEQLPAGPGRASDFWSDYQLVPCRDGKARRVGVRIQWLVNGIQCRMGTGGASSPRSPENPKEKEGVNHAQTSSARPGQSMRGMFEDSPPSKNGWETGGHDQFQKEEVLQPGLHGCGHGGSDQSVESSEQSQTIGEDQQESVRRMRIDHQQISRSSHRREPAQQCQMELEDALRLMPSAYACALIVGDTATIEVLQMLFPSCAAQRTVQHPPIQDAKAWKPPHRDEVERAWHAGHFAETVIAPMPVLTHDQPGRVMLLKGFGNAIVPQVAAQFVMSCEEARTEVMLENFWD